MKLISGKVISSKPISIWKAASTLSTFISTETGASEAVSAYLKRASASFNDLVQFHRELKSGGGSERKRKRSRFVDAERRNLRECEAAQIRGRVPDYGDKDSFEDRRDFTGVDIKKKRGFVDDREGGGGRIFVDEEDEKNSERKMKMKLEIEDVENDQNNFNQHRKKKKRKYEGEE
eukprot:TRINITY_DN7265_c0_g1_i19.p1 TRINITY_DN7265_c0_g1~~TRINITY_DN7265_c0_g1_i19.p1  ORF type:complete len:176 (+),score=34.56 TRINITY_DN7265_c0_g1_i19:442-969(+)